MGNDSQNTENRLDKIEKQLDNIAKSLITGFDSMNKQFDTKANNDDLQRVLGLLDKISKDIEISEDERLVISHQLTQIHDWVEKAAKKIDLVFAH